MSGPFYRMNSPKQLSLSSVEKAHDDSTPEGVKITSTPVPFDQDGDDRNNLVAPVSKFHDFVDRWWVVELVGWLASVGALLSVVAILYVHQGKPLPDWSTIVIRQGREYHFSITINALVSVFATTFKAALLIPVAAALSQLKWAWFQGGHKLLDFQTFDEANRGPLGSLWLIFAFRGRSLACLGGFIIVATLSLDFGFQQLISYPPLPVPAANASIPRTDSYENFVSGLIGGINNVDSSMLGAIFTGIYDIDRNFQVSAQCATGNCTWTAPYTSLGVCSRCFDSTSNIKKACSKYDAPTTQAPLTVSADYCNYTLPNGLEISGMTSGLNGVALNIAGTTTNSTSFQQMINPISILSMLSATWVSKFNDSDPGGPPLYNALSSVSSTECALYYCVQKYEATVTNGVLSEQLLFTYHNNSASFLGTPSDPSYENFELRPPGSFTNGTIPETTSFYVLPGAALALLKEFQNLWAGNMSINALSYNQYPSNDLASFLYPLNLSQTQTMMRNLAISITNNMRSTGGSAKAALGVASKDVPHVSVSWPWISLPASLLALTLVFLVCTIYVTSKKGMALWKGSSLAMFYHPLASDGRAQLSKAQGPRDTERIAGRMEVRWEQTERGWRLIQN